MPRSKQALAALSALVVGASLAVAIGNTPAASAQRCHPFTTEPTYAGDVPTSQEVLGFELGSQEVNVRQSDRYLLAVAEASDRVQADVLARSHRGRVLRYAVVGKPARVAEAKAAAAALRDPQTPSAEAEQIAAEAPAIFWIASNVHGDEPSGTDAGLRTLYELADRTDCAARRIRANSVVVILPIQNPDGREVGYRRNAYAFDMNRDWFARTQPETDGKIEAVREYPPVLFIDDHEMGSNTYFFPPNADPFYHELTDESVDWINNVYGAAMAREFDRQDIPYFNRSIYDMFYMGYGDTVPAVGFGAAGMTFEKDAYDSIKRRTYEQYVAQWASLSAGAKGKDEILSGWASSFREAYRQGVRGQLEPNQVINPGNEVQTEVPDERVRHYFIRSNGPGKSDDVRALVRRLMRMDVEVNRLTAPLEVPNYTPYGRQPRDETLPRGTYWVPMAQSQKHWVQAMLHEDTYVPFPYFYDVTAWSQPLLFNVGGGRSGAVLDPAARPARLPAETKPPALPNDAPEVAVYGMAPSYVSSWESNGWFRWLVDNEWEVPIRRLVTRDIRGGGLTGIDVLVVPNGPADLAEERLGDSGTRQLREWVADGGRYIGWRGGAELAARLSMTTARMTEPKSDVPGSLFRARVEDDSPLHDGVGPFVWNFYEYDLLMRATDPSTVAVSYPPFDHPDWFVSGFARGERELAGTAAAVDEEYADGRLVLLAAEPNFRAFTTGTQQIVWNAMFGPDPASSRPAARLGERRAEAAAAARDLRTLTGRMVVSVRPSAADSVRAIFARYGVDARSWRVSPGKTRFAVPMRSAEQSPYARDVVADLSRLDSLVVAVRVPSGGR